MRQSCCGTTLAAFIVLLAGPAVAAESARPSDADVTDWAEEAVAADPRVGGEGIEIATQDGIVTLSGTVSTLAGKRYAVLVVQKILGVLGVIDQLRIEALKHSDEDISAAVRGRIEGSQAIEVQGLEVTAREGVVRLAGEVGSGAQRNEAELLASEVAGVREVSNYLSADLDAERSDPQIHKDVVALLRRDVYLARLPIEVKVEAGRVILTGSVGSAYEKTRAESRVRSLDAVRDVSNRLEVEWWEDRGARLAAPITRTDAELAATVSKELEQDGRVDAGRIRVTAEQGRVSLLGGVASLRQKRIAEEDAWNVAGVGWVANSLEVTAEARPEAEILQAIRAAIASDPELSDAEIEVRVEGPVVTLQGRVASGYQRVRAGAIAARTRGVERLDNRLVATRWDERTDAELAREVQRRLARHWLTATLGERVRVGVQGGVVMLSGNVDRWSERRAAARVAADTPGVRKVRNLIVVQPYPYPWEEREPDADPEGVPDWDRYYFDNPLLPWIA